MAVKLPIAENAERPLPIAIGPVDALLEWGLVNSLWIFPMATSCCGIELMAAAASRVDLDRMGTIVRGTPRQGDVMVVAGTITVKMAPRVLALWEQMPEPKWCVAMGSCAISGDFYRKLYAVVPGVDTFLPVDVYIPGCPPNPEALMHGLLRLQEKVRLRRAGKIPPREPNPRAMEQERAAEIATAAERGDAPPVTSRGDGAAVAAELPEPDAIVPAAEHVAVARRLRALGYTQLVYVVATHFPGKTGERYEVAFALRMVGRGSKLARWRVALDQPSMPSLSHVFAGADWQEREQFDLVGVRFEGHPDLRRILLPADWTSHPLRRDFPADAACPPWR